MAFKRCEYKDGETVITAENLNAMQDAICEMEGIIEIHPTDMNNPHKVTAEQVGAHPNTWMPTAEDVGARPDTWMPSADDVGARPVNWMPTAEEVGARPADWMPTIEDLDLDAAPASHLEDTNNPHNVTAEQVGAAPAGWGWGEKGSYDPQDNDPDNVDRTCSFTASQGNVPAGGVWRGQFYSSSSGKNGVMYMAATTNLVGSYCTRLKINGEWQPWEWANPPMAVGVEYRTTERWNGLPVYVQTLHLGSATNATIDISGFGASRVLRYSGVIGRYSLPHINAHNLQGSWSAYLAVSNTGIEIKCGTSLTGQEVYCTIWYIKS